MSDKNGGNGGFLSGFLSNPFAVTATCVVAALWIGGRQIKQGYILGSELSRQALKRHDKEIRRAEKKAEKEKREALREKRRQERLERKSRGP